SDLLGASWQYNVNLTVIPARVEGKIVSSTNKQQSKIKNPQSKRNSSFSSKDVKTNDAGLISSISIEPAPSTSGNIAGNIASSDKAVGQNSKEKLRESLKAASDKQKPVSKKSPKKPLQKLSTTQNKTVSQKPVPKVRDSVKGLSEKAVKPANNAAKSNKTKVKKEATQSPDKKTTTLNQAVSEKSVQKSSAKPKASNKKNNTKDVSQKLAPKGDLAIIEPNSSPVRVKGDTAEQILQNLIELALPSNEALLPDDSIDDTLTTPAPLPLQLTLDKVNHVATWGETITVEGLAEPKQTTDLQIKQIAHAELEIELRSPQSSQLLQSFRLPNPNKLLPFAIACLINIPEECASKLIIGEVKLYGALDNRGAKKLLASQSFTITAEI
ncbi:MAG: hypothetical protein MJK14_07755, partial [Rivularia sp. ALOHA_DT_140]|nr:hypothetical protein [Rivularia sp. ALOHA_DT_140]